MEIRDYLEGEGKGKVIVIAVNWLEDFFGEPGDRVKDMAERIHSAIHMVRGTEETSRLFGDIRSVPGVFIFDGNGREVFRLGGDPGPSGRRQIRIHQIREAVERAEGAIRGASAR